MTTPAPATLARPAKPEANARLIVYGYQWGYGPFRWAYSSEALLMDRLSIIRLSRNERMPLDAIGPTQAIQLDRLPEEHYYVGGV
jgi:hypothetical protein